MTQYSILTIIFFFLTVAVIWSIWKFSRLKYLFLQKIITQKIINRPFFSTIAVKELVAYILQRSSFHRNELLKAVSRNDFTFILKKISSPILKTKIGLMLNGKDTIPEKQDSLLELMHIGLLLKKQDYEKAIKALQKIKLKKNEKTMKALKSLYTARIALFEGDMLTASEEASRALKIFQKANLLFEEAETYFLLGEIYRISGVFDTADFMLRAALKIFNFLSAGRSKTEVLGTLGLLMAVQQRFDEADDYLSQAKNIAKKLSDNESFCFLNSQQAMLKLLQGNTKEAAQLAEQSLKKHKTSAGQAFAADVLARASFAAKKWQKTIEQSTFAAEKYLKQRNYAARFENLYLLAEALVEKKKLVEAEDILRNLIKEEAKHKSCFHIANAQTLLGLVLLRLGDIKRAKTVFNQALEQELYNDRASGAAIDYANLAIIEQRCGNTDAAHKNLQAALSCAEEVDDELYSLIKNVQL